MSSQYPPHRDFSGAHRDFSGADRDFSGADRELPIDVPSYVPGWLLDTPAPQSPALGLSRAEVLREAGSWVGQPAPPATRRQSLPSRGRRTASRRYRLQIKALRAMWVSIFLITVFLPLALAPEAGEEIRPWSRGGIAIELCMTTGLLGLSMLAATVVLPSRMRSISRAFGIEQILRSHRALALITLGLVLAHVAFVLIDRPANLKLLYPPDGPNRARAGEAATIALLLLCWLSLRRRELGTRYEIWRMVHGMLAVVAIGGTYLHMIFLDHLMRNLAERSVFYTILVFLIGIFANRWLLRPFRSRRAAYVVKEIRPETPSTSTLVLRPSSRRQRRLRYHPGQFAWIRLDSPFGPLQGHPFTIASAPHDDRELEFTIRNTGDFTGSITVLTLGRKVFVDGPYGDFNDDHLSSRALLLVAAGVGITPMMSILRSHAHQRDRRPHVLVMSARTPEELMFGDELRHMSKLMNLTVVPVVSRPRSGWLGRTGRIDADLLASLLQSRTVSRSASVFVCGPPQMMADTRAALIDLGIDERHIHTEQFDLV